MTSQNLGTMRVSKVIDMYRLTGSGINPLGEKWYDAFGFSAFQQRPFFKIIKKLAEYEDMEEQGLLLRLPCKPGGYYL